MLTFGSDLTAELEEATVSPDSRSRTRATEKLNLPSPAANAKKLPRTLLTDWWSVQTMKLGKSSPKASANAGLGRYFLRLWPRAG